MIHALGGYRVALAHHWLVAMRGGERLLQEIADLVGEAPIFTLLSNPDHLSDNLRRRPIHHSFLQYLPFLRHKHRLLLPLMPWATASLKPTDYDVIICSDAATIKGIKVQPGALKICYCHSPMRYVWDLYDDYRREAGLMAGTILAMVVPWLRRWDRRAAGTVTAFVANSRYVRDRIMRHYNLPAVVIYPPVQVAPTPATIAPENFYLVVSELVGYKRVDLAVRACTELGRPLVVIGDGPRMSHLKKLAGPSVQLLGHQNDTVVRDHYARCRAFLFCGEEDFGLTPVEAQSHGRPVIAYGRGGACETVLAGRTGLWFSEQSVSAMKQIIQRFEQTSNQLWSPEQIHRHTSQFDTAHFRRRFEHFIGWCMEHYEKGGPLEVHRAMQTLPYDHFLTDNSI